jgi:hypothetical protein
MICFTISKKSLLKLTLSLLTAFIILFGGIDHADADELPNFLYVSGASSTVSIVNGSYERGADIGGWPFWYNTATTTNININNVSGWSLNYSAIQHTWIGGENQNKDISYIDDNLWYCSECSGGNLSVSTSSLFSVYGCMDNMAINYDPTATINEGCYYILPEETATSTRIINYTFSTSTNQIDLSYYVATSTEILLYVENRNERDGVINSAFSSTTAGLTALTNIPVTLPNPLSGAGYTYFTTKLVLASDHGVIFDWSVITVDLYAGVSLGGGSGVGTGYQPAECGITNIGGCFMNGLAVMFYPSQQAFNNFNSFVDLIKTKPPVGYFYVVKNNLNNLTSTSTSAFTVTIPSHIKEYLFTPFDVGIGGILWFFFAINFYKRLKHITV